MINYFVDVFNKIQNNMLKLLITFYLKFFRKKDVKLINQINFIEPNIIIINNHYLVNTNVIHQFDINNTNSIVYPIDLLSIEENGVDITSKFNFVVIGHIKLTLGDILRKILNIHHDNITIIDENGDLSFNPDLNKVIIDTYKY